MKYSKDDDLDPENGERVEVKLNKNGLDFKMTDSPYIRFAIGTSLMMVALSALLLSVAPNGLI